MDLGSVFIGPAGRVSRVSRVHFLLVNLKRKKSGCRKGEVGPLKQSAI